MTKPVIDLKKIEAELSELAGNIPVKVKKHKGCRLSCVETDKRTIFKINPTKIRTDSQLDNVLNECRASLIYGGV